MNKIIKLFEKNMLVKIYIYLIVLNEIYELPLALALNSFLMLWIKNAQPGIAYQHKIIYISDFQIYRKFYLQIDIDSNLENFV